MTCYMSEGNAHVVRGDFVETSVRHVEVVHCCRRRVEEWVGRPFIHLRDQRLVVTVELYWGRFNVLYLLA